MSRRPFVLLAAALVLLALPTVEAQKTCRINNGGYQSVEYPCDYGSSTPAQAPAKDEPWWADNTTQAVLALVGLVGSAGAGGYTYYRMRARRRTLSDFVSAVERTYAQHKASPAEGVPRLLTLRSEVRARHERGRLEDAQFFELEKRINDYVLRLRLAELERAFPDLPHTLLGEIRHRLADGLVTEEDAVYLERQAALHHLPSVVRERFGQVLAAWSREDRPLAEAAPPAPTMPTMRR